MGDIKKLIADRLSRGSPVRLHLTAESRGYAISRAKEVEDLAQGHGHVVRRLRSTLSSIMETRAFRRDLLAEAREELEAARAGGPPRWLIASLCLDSSEFAACAEPIPVSVHLEAGRNIFGPLLREFPRYDTSGAYIHGVSVDCSYHAIVSCRDVLDVPDDADIDPGAGEGRWLSLSKVRDKIQELLGDRRRIADEAALVRLTLIRMALQEALPTPDCEVWIDRVLKDGNVLLVRARQLHESRVFSYWCKFGSKAELRKERSNWERLGATKLYKVVTLQDLPADYTSILVSKADADLANEHLDFEEWIRTRRDEGNTADLIAVLTMLGSFFDDLHLERTRFGRPSRGRIHRMLNNRVHFTPRSRKNEEPLPLRQVSDGKYRLLYIKPRDAEGGVRFVLEATDGARRLVDWRRHDWRYRLWAADIREGSRVELTSKERWKPARRDDVLTWLMKLPGSYQRQAVKVKQRVDEFVGLAKDNAYEHIDLLAAAIHGDFHPRNVVMVDRQQAGRRTWDLRVVDVADAILPDEASDSMAHDFVTFEVDMRLRALHRPRDADERLGLLDRYTAFETALWEWCTADEIAAAGELAAETCHAWPQFPADVPMRDELWPAGIWRRYAVKRLETAVSTIPNSPGGPALWAAAASYAERLFLLSVAYMEYLDVAVKDDQERAIQCLAMAVKALEVLESIRNNSPWTVTHEKRG